jgi:hypothetical protein
MSQGIPASFGPVPLTIGQILDRIFGLFRGHFRLFLQIGSVLAAALFVIYGLVFGALFLAGVFPIPGHAPDPIRMIEVLLPSAFVAGIAFIAVYAIFEAAGTHSALQANAGIEVTFRGAYRVGLQNAGRLIWLMILRQLWIGLPVLGVFVLTAGLALALFRHGGEPAPGPIFVAFPLLFLAYFGSLAYAIIMLLRLAVALPVCVAEGVTARAALKRSLVLTRNAKGRIFLVLLVVYAAGYAAMMVVQFICMAVIMCGALLGTAFHVQWSTPLAAIGIGLAVLFLVAAMFIWIAAQAATYAIAFAVLYQDQILRIDGVAPVSPTEEPV